MEFQKNDEVLKQGDLVKCDVTCSIDGWHGDTCYTFYVGDIDSMSKEIAMFLHVSQTARDIGIEMCKPTGDSHKIANAIFNHLNACTVATEIEGVKKNPENPQTYKVLIQYTGHGIGREIHEKPIIENGFEQSWKYSERGWKLDEGMMFTVEPIVLLNPKETKAHVDQKDKWSVIVPNTLSCQFEHTIAITQNGHEVFTTPDEPFPDVWKDVLKKYSESP